MEKVVQIFKALADETRLKILIIISQRKICAKGIAKHLNISEAAVSQHIKVLKETGIITGEKVGYFVMYELQKAAFEEIITFIEEMGNVHVIKSCRLGVEVPEGCRASCQIKNKCCLKKAEGRI